MSEFLLIGNAVVNIDQVLGVYVRYERYPQDPNSAMIYPFELCFKMNGSGISVPRSVYDKIDRNRESVKVEELLRLCDQLWTIGSHSGENT